MFKVIGEKTMPEFEAALKSWFLANPGSQILGYDVQINPEWDRVYYSALIRY